MTIHQQSFIDCMDVGGALETPAEAKLAPILTARTGKNTDLFREILSLYAPLGSVVADVTYGRGYFWKSVPHGAYEVLASDISDRSRVSMKEALQHFAFVVADMGSLPYGNETVDAVVADPPYGQLSTRPQANADFSICDSYNLEAPRGPEGLKELYRAGLSEAFRVLKPSGMAIIKTQDYVNSGRQNWLHIDVLFWAIGMGFLSQDFFVLVQENPPIMRHSYQFHARKNHSYFWVFRKPKGIRAKATEEVEDEILW